MPDFKLDLDEIDRDVALLTLTDAAGVSLQQLPEKLGALATRIRELQERTKGAEYIEGCALADLETANARIRELEHQLAQWHPSSWQRIVEARDNKIAAQDALQASLFDAIAHGDEGHREWLREAITAHFEGKPVPTLRGSGRKDALLEEARELVEGLHGRSTSEYLQMVADWFVKLEALKP